MTATPLRILVVDDDDADRKLMKRLIRRAGFEADVGEATSAREALEFSAPDLDAVFLDHMLPGATGLSLLQDIRRHCPRAAILLMTGQGDEQIAKSAIQLGATDYTPKKALNEGAVRRMLQNGVDTATRRWQLEEQRRDLANFIDVVVHDFRAPIRAAAFLAEQISEDLAAGDTEAVQEGLALLRKSARNMMRTVRSLADHIKHDRENHFGAADAGELVAQVLAALDREIAQSGATVDVDLAADIAEIWCDPAQICQLLQNLLANAIKYAGEAPPRIRIVISRHAGDRILVEVRDAGIGVPEEYRERIFEPFKRLPTATGIEGIGLGLATAKKIVDRHGGRIWCDSTPGEGTTMSFLLSHAEAVHDRARNLSHG